MTDLVTLSPDSRSTAGVILLAIVVIEWGGLFMLRVVRGGQAATGFQQAFFRAGHAHAGVLVTLSLVCLILVDAARVTGPLAFLARNAIPAAAILMPAGFFLSAAGAVSSGPTGCSPCFTWVLSRSGWESSPWGSACWPARGRAL